MKYISRLLLAALLLPLFTSCEVEFSPNADWKNVPVVYCLLDQDDDTSWVRVERCHLSFEGVYAHGMNPDSINYREGEITVSILAYEGDRLADSIPFAYTLRQRDSGAFAGGMQPIYYAETRGLLKDNYDYFLSIRKADGTKIASSSAVRLIHYDNRNRLFSYMKNDKFGFYEISGNSSANCRMTWNLLPNARLYQPVIRFYYAVNGERRYVDIPCPRKTPDYNAASAEIYYPRSVFLADLRTALLPDTASRKEYLKRVDIYLTCCTEDLNAYLSTVNAVADLTQGRESYCNIEGGVGLFAARRTHLFSSYPADESQVENSGLYYFLQNLGVGLYLP